MSHTKSLGAKLRKLLGPHFSRKLGKIYKSYFSNIPLTMAIIEKQIPKNAVVLDIGGGDGEPINYLLELRPDLKIHLIDIGPNPGAFIAAKYQNQVAVYPNTSLDTFLSKGITCDCIYISDVLHHVPPSNRRNLLDQIAKAMSKSQSLIVKEFSPGGVRSKLGYWADKYISGDSQVSFLSEDMIKELFISTKNFELATTTPLKDFDFPNYALVFKKT